MNEVQGMLGAVYLHDGTSVSFVNEPTVSSEAYTVYTITDTIKKYWNDSVSLIVYKNGVTITSGFTIQYCGGKIIFTNPLLNTDVITVSGKYMPVVQGAGFFNFKITIQRKEINLSAFGDGWKNNITTIGDWTASVSKFFIDNNLTTMMVNKAVFAFYTDVDNAVRYEGYGYVKKDTVNGDSTDVIKEDVEIVGISKIYYVD